MKGSSNLYRVLVPTAFFGTVRVVKGDVVRRELLGCSARRLVETGVLEVVVKPPVRASQAIML